MWEVYSQSHVYGIGLGKGRLVGRFCRCMDCASEWALQTGTIQRTLDASVPVTLDKLIQETYPRFAVINAERLEQEAILARDPLALDKEIRLKLIAEPFFILDNDIRRDEAKTTGWRLLTALGCTGGVMSLLVTISAFASGMPVWGWTWVAITVGALWGASRLRAAEKNRYMKAHIYPRLASCLAPLRPSAQEMRVVMEQIQSLCALRTQLEDLRPLLEDARTRTPRPTGNPAAHTPPPPVETPRTEDRQDEEGSVAPPPAPPVMNPWVK